MNNTTTETPYWRKGRPAWDSVFDKLTAMPVPKVQAILDEHFKGCFKPLYYSKASITRKMVVQIMIWWYTDELHHDKAVAAIAAIEEASR